MKLDHIDQIAAEKLGGFLVRKDLVRRFSKQFPVPTYVVEFLLGRYCATTDENEIAEGLELVQKTLEGKAVSGGNEELFKARARENGEVKIIDIVTARLDAAHDVYLATLPSLRLTDVRISPEFVHDYERMLTGGFYAEITLEYDPAIAQEVKGASPFGVRGIREIQLAQRDVLETLSAARPAFTTAEWKDFLLRSAGYEPAALSPRARDLLLLRMVPLVERNYNLIELGPRGTGKSHIYQQITPYAYLLSGGKTTLAKMFVNNGNGQRGLVCHYDAICYDEVAGISFDNKDGVNVMKGYMESGEFSRGRESIRADGGFVFVGNYDVDMETQKRLGHLLKPLPPQMCDDTAFMDRLHAFLPGWDIPKMDPRVNLTDHFGLVSDFLSEAWHQLRMQSRVATMHGRLRYGPALSGRDSGAVNKTVSGLLKLLSPDISAPVSDEDLKWAVELALEMRERVKEQQKAVGYEEYKKTAFGYFFGEASEETVVFTAEGDRGALRPGDRDTPPPPPAPAAQAPATREAAAASEPAKPAEPSEGHREVADGQTGVSYDDLFGPWLRGARKIAIRDPFIQAFFQTRNLMDFIETFLRFRSGNDPVEITLDTVSDERRPDTQEDCLEQIKTACASEGIAFSWTYRPKAELHDRSIVTDTGWRIVLGRGLDIFYPFESNAFKLQNRLQTRRQCRSFGLDYIRTILPRRNEKNGRGWTSTKDNEDPSLPLRP